MAILGFQLILWTIFSCSIVIVQSEQENRIENFFNRKKQDQILCTSFK